MMLRVLGYWKDSEYGDLRRSYCGDRADAIYKISRAEEMLWDDTIVLVQTPLHLPPPFLPLLFRVGTQPPWREQRQLGQVAEVQGS